MSTLIVIWIRITCWILSFILFRYLFITDDILDITDFDWEAKSFWIIAWMLWWPFSLIATFMIVFYRFLSKILD